MLPPIEIAVGIQTYHTTHIFLHRHSHSADVRHRRWLDEEEEASAESGLLARNPGPQRRELETDCCLSCVLFIRH